MRLLSDRHPERKRQSELDRGNPLRKLKGLHRVDPSTVARDDGEVDGYPKEKGTTARAPPIFNLSCESYAAFL